MTTPDPILDAAADAALSLAAQGRWDRPSLRAVAAEAGLDLIALYGVVRSTSDVVDHVMARFDRAAVDELDLDADASARERAFDAAMARFDAMEPHRAGLVPLIRAARSDLGRRARLYTAHVRAARWLLEIAGFDTSGVAGAARVQGFAAILAATTADWLKDEAGDLSLTMRGLDQRLREVESWGERWPGARRARSGDEAAPGEADPAGPDPIAPRKM